MSSVEEQVSWLRKFNLDEDCIPMCKEIADKLEELQAAQRWVPVSERPKNENQPVLLLYPAGHKEFYIWALKGSPFVEVEDYDDPVFYLPLYVPPHPR